MLPRMCCRVRFNAAADLDALRGDFSRADALQSQALDASNNSIRRSNSALGLLGSLAQDHDLPTARRMMPQAQISALPRRGVRQSLIAELGRDLAEMALAVDDWRTAAASLDALPAKVSGFDFLLWEPNALRAYAHARLGDFALAHKLIDTTPGDCYLCVRMRGNIRATERKWDAASWWFADAVRQGPSLPFAETDWGRMLLQKGDVDGAIVKFQTANQKGPHFADPLELWGEALMATNRSDLALAKFEEAARYAPNWGRLHLKWGEALGYVGRKDEARAQYLIASTLALSVADAAELARDARS